MDDSLFRRLWPSQSAKALPQQYVSVFTHVPRLSRGSSWTLNRFRQKSKGSCTRSLRGTGLASHVKLCMEGSKGFTDSKVPEPLLESAHKREAAIPCICCLKAGLKFDLTCAPSIRIDDQFSRSGTDPAVSVLINP